MEIKRVFDILDNLKKSSSKSDILSAKENKKWVSHSVADFVNNANYVSAALLHLGLKRHSYLLIHDPTFELCPFVIQDPTSSSTAKNRTHENNNNVH